MKFLSCKMLLLCFVVSFIFAFTYRICEQHGLEARQACFWAVILVIETVFGVKVLRKLQLKDQEIALNDVPVVSEYESA